MVFLYRFGEGFALCCWLLWAEVTVGCGFFDPVLCEWLGWVGFLRACSVEIALAPKALGGNGCCVADVVRADSAFSVYPFFGRGAMETMHRDRFF